VPTFADLVSEAEQRLAKAKVDATLAREDSKAKPSDRHLRIEAELKSEEAAKAGRDVSFWRYESDVEREFQRFCDGDVVVDPVLWALAPRHGGEPDPYWLAAASLVRRGIATPPKGWRSSGSGEPFK
jgi:hypothetical protein